MTKYLGQFPIDLTTHPEYSKYQPKDWALYIIYAYSQFDGSEHKAWVLDQVARILHGAPITAVEARWSNKSSELRISVGLPPQSYYDWVLKYSITTNTTYYDEGVAP